MPQWPRADASLRNPFGPHSPDEGPRAPVGQADEGPVAQSHEDAQRVRVLAGGIAHDLNNALAAIIGNAEVAAFDVPADGEVAHSLREIVTVARRAGEHIRQLLAFSGQGRGLLELVPLTELAADTKRALASTLNLERVAVTRRSAVTVERPVRGDRAQLRELVAELLANAALAVQEHADPRDRFIAIETERRRAEPPQGGQIAEWLMMRVIDSGVGMEPSVRLRATDPYFTTRPHARGLGLAAVSGIIRAHDGWLAIASEPGVGTVATVALPMAEAAVAAPQIPLPLVVSHDEPAVGLWVAGPAAARAPGPGWEVCPPGRALRRVFELDAKVREIAVAADVGPEAAGLARLLRRWRPDLPIRAVDCDASPGQLTQESSGSAGSAS